MIKLEHCVLPSPEQMIFIIQGIREADGSLGELDSEAYAIETAKNGESFNVLDFMLGKKDHQLMQRLTLAGYEKRKYMRMMPVYIRITAPLYWWKEFDTVTNSCSTMHKITEKEFVIDDFSTEHLITGSLETLNETIDILNEFREWYMEYDFITDAGKKLFNEEITCKKDIWWQRIQLLPHAYNQTRNVMMDYEVLCDIYRQCKNHELDEWQHFCDWIEHLPWSELICQWEDEIPTELGWKADCMNPPVEK